jgi:cell division protein ZapA (FtsZ GTPase activity inhibitor)
MAPALFAMLAANEAEKAAPNTTIVDVQMIGASGRIFIAGPADDLRRARDRVDEALAGIKGRATK